MGCQESDNLAFHNSENNSKANTAKNINNPQTPTNLVYPVKNTLEDIINILIKFDTTDLSISYPNWRAQCSDQNKFKNRILKTHIDILKNNAPSQELDLIVQELVEELVERRLSWDYIQSAMSLLDYKFLSSGVEQDIINIIGKKLYAFNISARPVVLSPTPPSAQAITRPRSPAVFVAPKPRDYKLSELIVGLAINSYFREAIVLNQKLGNIENPNTLIFGKILDKNKFDEAINFLITNFPDRKTPEFGRAKDYLGRILSTKSHKTDPKTGIGSYETTSLVESFSKLKAYDAAIKFISYYYPNKANTSDILGAKKYNISYYNYLNSQHKQNTNI